MRAGLFLKANHVEEGELDKPTVREGEALLKVSLAGICGTDMMIYSGKHPRAKAPLAMGHEFCGVVEEVRAGSDFAPGDRVVVEPTISCGVCEACKAGQFHVCRTLQLIGIDKHGGFAEYVAVPLNRLHRIPDSLSDEQAALTEPLAVAIHTVRRSALQVGNSVVILGAGPIGLLIGMIAKLSGAQDILISDISPYRLAKAKELGFISVNAAEEDVVAATMALTGGKGADVVFEVAGTQSTAQQMVEMIKIQGQIVVVSVFKTPPAIDLAKMHFKEISLTTTRCYSSSDFTAAIQMMASGKIDLSTLISHQLELSEITYGFELMKNSEVSLKVLIKP
ncbi:alcohol dehydrogenase catalytic domain-containing protein [Paenibacillus sp. LMG 31461]|uniref:Alcohol dehydrogenase catalytic domain-containing protein n=1 Tax=Paenibacillus plantarum TaxID=2654975 RepID=A0ABX1XNR2_9BACL|nr:alcohol dehydrogenase catalytic domain-containing protein [Paenibacillus plantarum]NOU69681.1 alcohol dehydrogenase catalytic domain-containing protein [Paenibacillus plantarum]